MAMTVDLHQFASYRHLVVVARTFPCIQAAIVVVASLSHTSLTIAVFAVGVTMWAALTGFGLSLAFRLRSELPRPFKAMLKSSLRLRIVVLTFFGDVIRFWRRRQVVDAPQCP
ncbi:hypothetical protein STSO111631_23510 [Stackebrandtia soli]